MIQMSKWRFVVRKKNINTLQDLILDNNFPEYIHLTPESVKANGGDNNWRNNMVTTPTKFIHSDDYLFDAAAYSFGDKTYPHSIGLSWFYPAKRLGRMFPRHKQQITYKDVI